MSNSPADSQILMEAGFKIIPGKEAEFLEVQNKMAPVGMSQPGFVSVYGGPIADSQWLYFGVRFASAQQMEAWHQHRGHRAVQRSAYEKWWTAMYLRKWQRSADAALCGDRLFCETRINRESALSDSESHSLKSELLRLAELGAKRFETLTGQYDPQPYQLVGPLEIAPASAPVAYSLLTHWSSAADLSRWQESGSYKAIQKLGDVTSDAFLPFVETGAREFLRSDKLQRDWTLASV